MMESTVETQDMGGLSPPSLPPPENPMQVLMGMHHPPPHAPRQELDPHHYSHTLQHQHSDPVSYMPVPPISVMTRGMRADEDNTIGRKRSLSVMEGRITPAAEKRVRACVLIADANFTQKAACQAVGLNPTSFCRAEWLKKYTEGGLNALLTENRGGSRRHHHTIEPAHIPMDDLSATTVTPPMPLGSLSAVNSSSNISLQGSLPAPPMPADLQPTRIPMLDSSDAVILP